MQRCLAGLGSWRGALLLLLLLLLAVLPARTALPKSRAVGCNGSSRGWQWGPPLLLLLLLLPLRQQLGRMRSARLG